MNKDRQQQVEEIRAAAKRSLAHKTSTPFDTGTRLEPFVYQVQPANLPDTEEADRYGRVDFDNDEARTMVTVWAEPGPGGVVNVWVEKKTDVERVHVHLIDCDPMVDAD